jgi:hypothetical protein
MFSMTQDEYNKQSAEAKRVFDHQAVALCLMLRKEFGERKCKVSGGCVIVTKRKTF